MDGLVHRTYLGPWSTQWATLKQQVSRQCQNGRCRNPNPRRSEAKRSDYLVDALTYVNARLRALQPSVVVFGPGPWIAMREQFRPSMKAFMEQVKALVGPNGRAIFKTCPRGKHGFLHGCGNTDVCGDEPMRSLAEETGWEVFDMYRLSDELHGLHTSDRAAGASRWNLYRDMFHFSNEVYRELNRLLLA